MAVLIGLDYGEKTVGVALSDIEEHYARPVETVRRETGNHLRKTCARIQEIIKENNVEKIVVGLPLNMDGSRGERAEAAASFADMIMRRTGLEVVLVDERLTSVEAQEYIKTNYSGKEAAERIKKDIDNVAAAIILQDYLNSR
ncbi:MAG: Holliday junction resolvase RuvX [Lachnospiraceae bacterium]|nr:Holliday junction resolvase RuvX [Lachnospiraceae bacterium]